MLFCLTVSRNVETAFRLLVNTKRKSYGIAFYPLTLYGKKTNIYLRSFVGDIPIFYDIFWRKIYELPAEIFRSAKIIVDLGAHTGMTSLYFTLRTNATVYAVEADPDNFALLAKNVHNKVNIVNAAVANTDTTYLKKSNLGYNTSVSEEKTNISVAGITMDALLSKYQLTHIDILKIDIEGSEKALFSTGTGWLEKVRYIIIELHNEEMEKLFAAKASQYGFKIERKRPFTENIYFAYKA